MEAKYWQLEIGMQLAEPFFSYALDSMKHFTECSIANELSLRFGHSMEYNAGFYALAAMFAFIIGWVTDSYVGKFYFVIAAVVFLLLTYNAFLVTYFGFGNIITEILAPILMFAYIILSNVRNLLILDQVHIMKRVRKMRQYIWFLVYSRTFVRLAFYIFVDHNPDKYTLNLHFVGCVTLVLLYLIILLAVGHNIHFEPIFFQICERSILGIDEALQKMKSANQSRDVSTVYYIPPIPDHVHGILKSTTQEDAKLPRLSKIKNAVGAGTHKQISIVENEAVDPRKAKFVDDVRENANFLKHQPTPSTSSHHGIRLDSHLPLHVYRAKFVNPINPGTFYNADISESEIAGIIPQSNFSEKIFQYKHTWGFHSVMPTPKQRASIKSIKSKSLPRAKSSSGTVSYFDRIFKLKRVEPPPLPPVEPLIIELKSDENEEVRRVKSFLIQQNIRLLRILPFTLLGVGITSTIYFTLDRTIKQASIVKRCYPRSTFEETDIILYSLIFDLFLFPIVEFIVIPLLRTYFHRDLQFVLLGYAISLLSGLVMLGFESIIISTVDYIPNPWHSNVRFINDFNSETYIQSAWLRRTKILPNEFYFASHLEVSRNENSRQIHIMNAMNNLDIIRPFVLIERKTITYIITPDGLVRSSEFDPSVFNNEKLKCDHNSNIFVVSTLELESVNFLFKAIGEENNFSQQNVTGRSLLSISPGSYEIYCEHSNRQKSMGVIQLEGGALYMLYVYRERDENIHGKIKLVESPVRLYYSQLLFQVLILSVGITISNSAFFRFLYLESPSKMKTFVFNVLFSLNLLLIGFFSSTTMTHIILLYPITLYLFYVCNTLLFIGFIQLTKGFSYRYEGF